MSLYYDDFVAIKNAVDAAHKQSATKPLGQKIVEQLEQLGFYVHKNTAAKKNPVGRPEIGKRDILRRLTSAQLRVLAQVERFDPNGAGIESTTFTEVDRESLRRLLGYGYVERESIKLEKITLFKYKITREGRLRLLDPEKLLQEKWCNN